jgi:hypothetical protein
MGAKVHLRRYRDSDGYVRSLAVIDMPTHVGALRVTAVGSWFSDALSSASRVAKSVLDNPIAKAIMPPQVDAAIKGIHAIASAAQRGPSALNSILTQYTGPGKARLVNALKREVPKRRRAALVDQRRPMPRAIPQADAQYDDDAPADDGRAYGDGQAYADAYDDGQGDDGADNGGQE